MLWFAGAVVLIRPLLLVTLGAPLFGVPEMVVVVAFLELLGDGVMFCMDRGWRSLKRWLPLVVTAARVP
jgi:hypothetical protein